MRARDARSFPLLIHDLALRKHDGALLTMALHSRIPQSTLWRWVRAMPSRYNPDLIRRLCTVYDLPVPEVFSLIHRDEMRRLYGKPVPLPDLTDVRRGPVARKAPRHGRRAPVIAGGSGNAEPLPVASKTTKVQGKSRGIMSTLRAALASSCAGWPVSTQGLLVA